MPDHACYFCMWDSVHRQAHSFTISPGIFFSVNWFSLVRTMTTNGVKVFGAQHGGGISSGRWMLAIAWMTAWKESRLVSKGKTQWPRQYLVVNPVGGVTTKLFQPTSERSTWGGGGGGDEAWWSPSLYSTYQWHTNRLLNGVYNTGMTPNRIQYLYAHSGTSWIL